MKRFAWQKYFAVLVAAFVFLAGCVKTEPVPTGKEYNFYELKYLLLGKYSPLFYCDPDEYPIGINGEMYRQRVLEQFEQIRRDTEKYNAILASLGVVNAEEFDGKKMVYEENQLLNAIILERKENGLYEFHLHRDLSSQGKMEQSLIISGIITSTGKITVLEQKEGFNTCPICSS